MARIIQRKSTPALIEWRKNDSIFPADHAHPYKCDLKKIDFHLLDIVHFALEGEHELIADLICSFLR